jgi:hypothetical protein
MFTSPNGEISNKNLTRGWKWDIIHMQLLYEHCNFMSSIIKLLINTWHHKKSYKTQICIVVTNIIVTSGNKTNPHCMINNEHLQHQMKKCQIELWHMGAIKHNTCDYQMNVVTISHCLFNGRFTHGIINITNGNVI